MTATPGRQRKSVSMPPGLYDEARAYCERRGIALADLTCALLWWQVNFPNSKESSATLQSLEDGQRPWILTPRAPREPLPRAEPRVIGGHK